MFKYLVLEKLKKTSNFTTRSDASECRPVRVTMGYHGLPWVTMGYHHALWKHRVERTALSPLPALLPTAPEKNAEEHLRPRPWEIIHWYIVYRYIICYILIGILLLNVIINGYIISWTFTGVDGICLIVVEPRRFRRRFCARFSGPTSATSALVFAMVSSAWTSRDCAMCKTNSLMSIGWTLEVS